MNQFVLRLTHIIERLNEDRDKILDKYKCAFADRTPASTYVLRLIDEFDNIYYGEVVVFKEDFDGLGRVYSATFQRQFVGRIPKAKACLEHKYLWMQHPPLCTNCWQNGPPHLKTVNEFRLILKNSVKAPCPDVDAPYPQDLLELFSDANLKILEEADDPLMLLEGRSMN